MDILGVRIDPVTRCEAQARVRQWLHEPKSQLVFTPNPEMLVYAHHSPAFRDILNSGDLNLCDGRGIQLAAEKKIERIPGVDFMLDICAIAAEGESGVYLLGSGNQETVNRVAANLQKQFPTLHIVGANPGPKITLKKNNNTAIEQYNNTICIVDVEENNEIITNITKKNPDILFVAFGHPKQELWLHDNVARLPSVRIAMGVGGSFDYIAGAVHRAPRLWQKIGVEWLWRLLHEPRRLGRIWKATFFFPYLVFRERHHHK